MTIVKYLLSTGVCTTAELLALKREDDTGYRLVMQWAREQAANLEVPIEDSPAK